MLFLGNKVPNGKVEPAMAILLILADDLLGGVEVVLYMGVWLRVEDELLVIVGGSEVVKRRLRIESELLRNMRLTMSQQPDVFKKIRSKR